MMRGRSLEQTIQAALNEPELISLFQEHTVQRAKWQHRLSSIDGRNGTTHPTPPPPSPHSPQASNQTQSGSLPVANCDNIMYTTTIGLGSQQRFSVVIDSGSSDLWVASSWCHGKFCPPVTGYQSNQSSTYEKMKNETQSNFEITYLDGMKVTGEHGMETLHLGESVTVQNQVFAQATSISHGLHACDDVGTLGLGFGAISSHGFPTLLSNLKSLLPHPVFSLYLSHSNDYKLRRNETTGINYPIPDQGPIHAQSELTFGGVNASRYTGCLHWHKLGQFRAKGEIFKGYWDFGLEQILVGNHEIPASKLAMIDSGSTVVVGSRESVGYVAKLLNLQCFSYTVSGHAESVACDHPFGFDIAATSCFGTPTQPIVFVADGTRYELEENDLLRLVSTAQGPICVLDLVGVPGFPGWLLGMNFLRKYYTVFNFGSNALGFARASRVLDTTLCEADAHLNIDQETTYKIVQDEPPAPPKYNWAPSPPRYKYHYAATPSTSLSNGAALDDLLFWIRFVVACLFATAIICVKGFALSRRRQQYEQIR